MNDTSSRSHCITKLTLQKILINQETKSEYIQKSELRFFDLAGSERVDKTERTNVTQIKKEMAGMEGIMINMDLFTLGNII